MEKKVFHVINERTLKGEDYETKEAAINAAWRDWNGLTESEMKDNEHRFTVYEAVKIWDDNDPEFYEYEFYDLLLDIHYMSKDEALEAVEGVFDDLNDFIKPTLDGIYDTMERFRIGHISYDEETRLDFLDDPEYYTDEIMHALILMIEVPELKSRLNDIYSMRAL